MLGRVSRLSAAALLVAVAVNATARAQDTASTRKATLPRYRFRVLGVFDDASGNPVEGARVLDVLNGNSALTTRTGTVSLAFLPDGGSLVRIQHVGYEVQTLTIGISPADTAPLTIMLTPATLLPTVVTRDSAPKYISPKLRGFEDRRRIENGYFITEAELRKNDGRTLANVLMSKPGVQIHQGMSNSAFLWRSPRCVNGGPPQVYLDGIALSPTPTTDAAQLGAARANPKTVFGMKAAEVPNDPDLLPFNLADYNVSDLAAVEWYPDPEVVPPEFGHTAARCGAVLLWTRER